MATYRQERSGLKFENIGLTFSILTVFLGTKCLMPFLSFERFFVAVVVVVVFFWIISECTFIILA